VFDPFAISNVPPCSAPYEIPCELPDETVKVQREAPAHLLTLVNYEDSQVSERTVRFKTMGTGVDVYVVDGNVASNDEFSRGEHGTHVSSLAGGISYGLGKNVTIIPVSVQPGCGMSGRVSDLAQGLAWVSLKLSNKPPRPSIVSMSLQLPKSDPASQVIESLTTDLLSQGAILVAAAGNYRSDACVFRRQEIQMSLQWAPWTRSFHGKTATTLLAWTSGLQVPTLWERRPHAISARLFSPVRPRLLPSSPDWSLRALKPCQTTT
jgi:subtilisin family serine protease